MPVTEVQRRVRFDHEELDAVRMMIRTDGTDLKPGKQIEVEIGARSTGHGVPNARISGVWIPCVVVSDTPRELVLRLL